MGAGLPSWKPPQKPRINWKKRLKDERNRVIDEAIRDVKSKAREVPQSWQRGYSSAITTLEMMKDE